MLGEDRPSLVNRCENASRFDRHALHGLQKTFLLLGRLVLLLDGRRLLVLRLWGR